MKKSPRKREGGGGYGWLGIMCLAMWLFSLNACKR